MADIAIGFDHAGYDMALGISNNLLPLGHSLILFGPTSSDVPVDYAPYCIAAAESVIAGSANFAVVLGGTGQGEQMAANKVRGARAALCIDPTYTMLTRRDNDANVLALPARRISLLLALELVDIFMATQFEGGRHARRLADIAHYEEGKLERPAGRRIGVNEKGCSS